ncbi:MAG: hypothetical protein E2O61_01190 [Gammaproteobacteria bacterium]|nr:MAG: hypothetical protein E2O61_01190 [Gammaproteobacteria bacterium]
MSIHTCPIRVSAATRLRKGPVRPRRRNDLWSMFLATVLFSLVLFAQGCGSGGGSTTPQPDPIAESGVISIVFTDAEGDFVTYAVDVTSLLLEKTNGDTVETVPLSTRIDFAELTDVSEFLTIATVPAGIYASAVLTMDFTTADVVVQDANGDGIGADVVGEDGNPLGVLQVRLNLTTSDVIRISPNVPAAFSLDFDLDASNEIDLTTTPPTVTVQPFLLATPELDRDREHRVRGVLASVDEIESAITIKVRPFRHHTGDFGRFTFSVDEDTQYEVDGVGYTGSPGLGVMAMLEENTPVITQGQITDNGFLAETVLAGSSVPWSDSDVVKGIVIARSGDVLSVQGARIKDGRDVFWGSQSVIVGENTTVTALGVDNADLDLDSISVGQRVIVFGEELDDGTFDASEGRVRMLMNQLTAQVVEAEPLVVDLFYLNGRHPQLYDFSGTGVTAAEDADPDFYEIDTSTLGLSNIENGDLVRVRGLVNDFGMASPDYNARTVIDVDTDAHAASLRVGWKNGTTMPFTNLSIDRIDLDLSEARVVLKLRGVSIDINTPIEALALVAPGSDRRGIYAVKVRGTDEIHLYREFADLVGELNAQLDAGNLLHRIGAHGGYNSTTGELTTGRASFEFGVPTATDS